MHNDILASVVPNVRPMQNLDTGAQVVNASIGFMLLTAGAFLTHAAVSKKKKTIFPYTLEESAVVSSGNARPEVHALLALISFILFGWAGTTLLLSGPGVLGDTTRWLQDQVSTAGEQSFLADAGAPGISLILLMLALSSKTNHWVDFLFGALAGIIWPLGGGPWLESSRGVGELGVEVYGWLEDLASWAAELSPLAIIGFILVCLAASYTWREHIRARVQEKVSK